MDQLALADKAGVDPKTLRSLEKGYRWPREGSRARIENALNWPTGVLDLLLEEAMASHDSDGDLPSSSLVLTPEAQRQPDGTLISTMLHPSRMMLAPEPHPVPYQAVVNLLDAARSTYTALEDIANGDSAKNLPSQTARLHKAAMLVVRAWAGDEQGLSRIAQTVPPDLGRAIERDPESAMELVERIRERKAD